MANKKVKKKMKKENVSCNDKKCPIHGSLKVRGRIFKGKVESKKQNHVTILKQRMFFIRKYERYEKRTKKIHAHLPECMKEKINVGDMIRIGECRPLSKTIHFVVLEKVEQKSKKEKGK